MDDLHINKHFDLFKKLLFMEDGEFSLSLSNQLFEKVPVNRTVHSRNYLLRVTFPLENLRDRFFFTDWESGLRYFSFKYGT